MLDETIRNFHTQFSYKPVIENAKNWQPPAKYLLAGMGGSHLAADLIKTRLPSLDLIIHQDYGLPAYTSSCERAVIASSYSGNTEETIDAFVDASKKCFQLLAITTGGELLRLAKQNSSPYIEISPGIQPRSALGYSALAFATALRLDEIVRELEEVGTLLNEDALEEEGRERAERLKGFVPVIYSSSRNASIAYNWKIKFNETGKIPAFYNVFPELNHNEMTGFDIQNSTRSFSEKFYFIFLQDPDDDERIKKRMRILEQLYKTRGLGVETLALSGKTPFHKIFDSLVRADWSAYHTALLYNIEPEHVPFQEEFKKAMKEE